MKSRTLLVLSLILFVLAAITFFTTPKKKAPERISLIPETIKIKRLKIESKKGTFAFERKGDDWFITYPIKTKADGMEMDSILYRLQQAKSSKILEKSPKGIGKYGLKNPEKKVEYEDESGKKETIAFGNINPTGEFVYTLTAGNLLLTDRTVQDIFNKTLNDLREKRIFWGRKKDVGYIKAVVSGKAFLGKRVKDTWKAVKVPCGKGEKVNPDGFQDILDDFGFLRFEKIEDNLKEPSGKKPIINIVFKNKKGSTLMDLRIYPKGKDGYYPTFEVSRGARGVIEDTRFNMIKGDIEEICKKEVKKGGSEKDKGQKGDRKESGKGNIFPERGRGSKKGS